MDSLRSLRIAAGLSQGQLAAKAGVEQTSISQIEAGRVKHGPRLDTVQALADALGVDLATMAAAVRASQAA